LTAGGDDEVASPLALVAINFASSAIKSSELSGWPDIYCGSAAVAGSAPMLLVPRPDTRAFRGSFHTNAPEL
jgi:hypothetical protein